MTTRLARTSPQVIARVAGILYVLIAVVAIYSVFIVSNNLIVPGDATATATNIAESEGQFRAGILGYLIIFLSEIVLTTLLYVLLKPVSKTLSLMAAIFRLVMTTIHGINLLNRFFVLILLSGVTYLSVFETEQLHALVLLFLDAHDLGFAIGIVFLSFHVLILGYLVYRSGFIPRIFGVLLFVAFFGYLIDSFAMLLVAGYDATPLYLVIPIFVAEVVFPLWLVIRGVNVERWEQRSRDSA